MVEIQKNRERLEKLHIELGKSLTGESVYEYADLKESIRLINGIVDEQEKQLLFLQEDAKKHTESVAAIVPIYKRFKGWADEFQTASIEQKKMIACQLFTRIEIGRDYKVKVTLDMTYQQFCTEWKNNQQERKAV